MSDMQFVVRYRLSKEVVVKLVCEIKGIPTTNYNLLPQIEEVSLSLYFFFFYMFKLTNNDEWSGNVRSLNIQCGSILGK